MRENHVGCRIENLISLEEIKKNKNKLIPEWIKEIKK
jgi:hypothetical protein